MATEKRLIDANAFKVFLEDVRQCYLEEDTFSSDFAAAIIETVQDNYLELAPTVEAVEVVHGYWKYEPYEFGYKKDIKCSECYCYVEIETDYCPYCGAKMDGERNAVD